MGLVGEALGDLDGGGYGLLQEAFVEGAVEQLQVASGDALADQRGVVVVA